MNCTFTFGSNEHVAFRKVSLLHAPSLQHAVCWSTQVTNCARAQNQIRKQRVRRLMSLMVSFAENTRTANKQDYSSPNAARSGAADSTIALLLSSALLYLRSLSDKKHATLAPAELQQAKQHAQYLARQAMLMSTDQLVETVFVTGKLQRHLPLVNVCCKARGSAMSWFIQEQAQLGSTVSAGQWAKLWIGVSAGRQRVAPQWLQLIEAGLLQHMDTAPPYQLAGIAAAWATSRIRPSDRLLEAHGAAFMKSIHSFPLQSLTNVLWAWATMKKLPATADFDVISDVSLGMLEMCSPWQLSIILLAHAECRHLPDDVVMYLLLQKLEAEVDMLPRGNVPGLLVTFAKLDVPAPRALVDKLLRRWLMLSRTRPTDRQLCQACWALCVMYTRPTTGRTDARYDGQMDGRIEELLRSGQSSSRSSDARADALADTVPTMRRLLASRRGGTCCDSAEEASLLLQCAAAVRLLLPGEAPLLDSELEESCLQVLQEQPLKGRTGLQQLREKLREAAALLPGMQRVAQDEPQLRGLFYVDVLCTTAASQKVALVLAGEEWCFRNVPSRLTGHKRFRTELLAAAGCLTLTVLPQDLAAASGKLQRLELLQRLMFAAGL